MLIDKPDVTEEGIVIAQSSEIAKLGFKNFEKTVVEFGSQQYPLNLYGDHDPLPKIGAFMKKE